MSGVTTSSLSLAWSLRNWVILDYEEANGLTIRPWAPFLPPFIPSLFLFFTFLFPLRAPCRRRKAKEKRKKAKDKMGKGAKEILLSAGLREWKWWRNPCRPGGKWQWRDERSARGQCVRLSFRSSILSALNTISPCFRSALNPLGNLSLFLLLFVYFIAFLLLGALLGKARK